MCVCVHQRDRDREGKRDREGDRKAFLAMMPQLIPVSETYEALVAGVKKTTAMHACMVFKTYSNFENFPAVTAYVLGVYCA